MKAEEKQKKAVAAVREELDAERRKVKLLEKARQDNLIAATMRGGEIDGENARIKIENVHLKGDVAGRAAELSELQQRLQSKHAEVLGMEQRARELQQKIDEMEDTMSIKDRIFAEHVSTAENLTVERESLIDEIAALKRALEAERSMAGVSLSSDVRPRPAASVEVVDDDAVLA